MFKVHESSLIDDNVIIGDNTKIWAFSHISRNARIGNNCTIGEGVYIGPYVKIGNNCKIQNHALIYEGVEIGNNVFIGPNVVTTNDIWPSVFGDWSDRFRKTHIKDGSAIGANSTIICGITIYENSFIAAGSVVTKDVLENQFVKGNPAQPFKVKNEFNTNK